LVLGIKVKHFDCILTERKTTCSSSPTSKGMDREGWQDQKIKLQPVQTKVDKGINKIIQARATKMIRKRAIGLEYLTKDMTLKIQINAKIAWSISPMYNVVLQVWQLTSL
jgi:hypothetical protein